MQSFLAALCDAMQTGQTDRGKQDLFAHSLLMGGRSQESLGSLGALGSLGSPGSAQLLRFNLQH